jgi:hypothetical protein
LQTFFHELQNGLAYKKEWGNLLLEPMQYDFFAANFATFNFSFTPYFLINIGELLELSSKLTKNE